MCSIPVGSFSASAARSCRSSRGGYSGGASRHAPAARNIHPGRDGRRRASVPHGDVPIRAPSRRCRARPSAAAQSRSSRPHCVSLRVCRTPRRADPARRAEAAGAEPKNSAATPVRAASDAKACHGTRRVKPVRRDSAASMPSSVSCDRPIRGDFHRAGLSFHLE